MQHIIVWTAKWSSLTSLAFGSSGAWASFVCLIFSTIFLKNEWLLFSFFVISTSNMNHKHLVNVRKSQKAKEIIIKTHHLCATKEGVDVIRPQNQIYISITSANGSVCEMLTLWCLWAVQSPVVLWNLGHVPASGSYTALHTLAKERGASLEKERENERLTDHFFFGLLPSNCVLLTFFCFKIIQYQHKKLWNGYQAHNY